MPVLVLPYFVLGVYLSNSLIILSVICDVVGCPESAPLDALIVSSCKGGIINADDHVSSGKCIICNSAKGVKKV